MMRSLITASAILVCIPILTARAQIGELLQVRPDGAIVPSNAVATIQGVAAAAAAAAAAASEAAVTQSTGAAVSNNLVAIQQIINGLEGIGYIRAYVLDFGVGGTEVNTNVTATIVDFVPAISNDATYVYSDVYTFFSESPAEFPVCMWQASLGRSNEWNVADSVAIALTDRLVNDVYYAEVYRNTVRVPVASASAFFRIFAEAVQSQIGSFLPVKNGISPGGKEPLTATFSVGTNTISYVGGIRVVPD